ncbi:MAG: hypothetical protein OEY28_09980 [Nitrospira sp.]|nr:hypothetical protein [Nitrospira sp.]
MAINQKPFHQIRVGSVRASIWENPSEKGPFFSVTFSRSYKDRSGQWQNGQSYLVRNLDALIDCTQEAKALIRRHRQATTRVA